MKRFKALVLCAFLVVSTCFAFVSCKTGQGQYNPSTQVYDTNAPAASVVVTAEKLRASALDAFDLLMREEYTLNQLHKSNPTLHQFVEGIRKNGQTYLSSLTAAKSAYQSARTGESLDKLNASIAFLQTVLADVLANLKTIKGAK